MSILSVNRLALKLVAMDFSNGHAPNQAGPAKTARALDIIHLAARDAFASVTSVYPPQLSALPSPPATFTKNDATGLAADLGAGLRTSALLYPYFTAFINTQSAAITEGADPAAVVYGSQVGDQWFNSRQANGSGLPQADSLYSSAPGHYRPDPVSLLPALGRTCGQVTPFILAHLASGAPLPAPPDLTSKEYASAFDDDFTALNSQKQINVLAAVNAAMADAGIAAWHWKYVYDFWRPITAIREAGGDWGPTGDGDGKTFRKRTGDPFWTPVGAPKSNPLSLPASNYTPNFPAYPSGHATFGTACFLTFAGLVGKTAANMNVTFVSDEYNWSTDDAAVPNGTVDNLGVMRPRWEQTFMAEAIEQNKLSRIYFGMHWQFDAEA